MRTGFGQQRTERSSRPSPIVVASYVAYAAVGWYLSGLGAVLPDLEQEIGRRADLYPLLPGAALFAWGAIVIRRDRRAEPLSAHRSAITVGATGLGAATLVMGATRWGAVSALGAAGAAFAAATLIRLLPAALATARPGDTERVMMRANAWSSLAAIAAPLAVGATIAVGSGWLPGFAVPIAIGAVVVLAVIRSGEPAGATSAPVHSAAVVPPLRTWWREWSVLALCIVVEFCFVYFAATFLHDERGLTTAAAARGAAAWGIGMAVGRFAVSAWSLRLGVLSSAGMIAVGFVLFWAVPSPVVSIVGIGVAGFGASPLYPSRMTALLERFPRSLDQGSTRGSIASGAALLGAPALMVALRRASDVRLAYLAVPVLLLVLVVLARPRRGG